MAYLGAVGMDGLGSYQSPDKGPRQTLRGILCDNQLLILGGQDNAEGSPSAPSLRINTFGARRMRWAVSAGTRTLSIKVKQPINESPRPRLRILANPAIGVSADVSDTAASGTGWVTIGPLTITPSSAGRVWILLENLHPGQYAPCYWDHIERT